MWLDSPETWHKHSSHHFREVEKEISLIASVVVKIWRILCLGGGEEENMVYGKEWRGPRHEVRGLKHVFQCGKHICQVPDFPHINSPACAQMCVQGGQEEDILDTKRWRGLGHDLDWLKCVF